MPSGQQRLFTLGCLLYFRLTMNVAVAVAVGVGVGNGASRRSVLGRSGLCVSARRFSTLGRVALGRVGRGQGTSARLRQHLVLRLGNWRCVFAASKAQRVNGGLLAELVRGDAPYSPVAQLHAQHVAEGRF